MSLRAVSFPQMAFAPVDIIADIGKFTEIADIGRFSLVCKAWKQAMEYNIVWSEQFEKNGIPRVFGSNRNFKNDFLILYPITLSGKVIQKHFGRIGKLPFMDPKKFDEFLNQEDPWKAGTKRRSTFKAIVDPDYIIRSYDKDLFDVLAKDGDPAEVAVNAAEMRIPFSLRNRMVLVKHLFAKHEYGPIFSQIQQDVLTQCNLPITETTLYVMRKEVIGRGLPYTGAEGQQSLAKSNHMEIASLAIRILFDTIEVLESGTCPDKRGDPLWTFARTSSAVRLGNVDYPVAIGGFAPGSGLLFRSFYSSDAGDDGVGVAPGVPAQVRPFSETKDYE